MRSLQQGRVLGGENASLPVTCLPVCQSGIIIILTPDGVLMKCSCPPEAAVLDLAYHAGIIWSLVKS